MASRCNAATDRITLAASVAASTNFTVSFWYYIATDRNAISTVFFMGTGTSVAATNALALITQADGTTLDLWFLDNSAARFAGLNLTAARWYHIAIVGSTTASAACTMYVYDINANTLNTYNGTAGAGSFTAGNTAYVADAGGWSNARVLGGKIWSGVQLTQDQLDWERWFFLPVFEQGNIWAIHPLTGNGDTRDLSGNARTLTHTSVTAEDGPSLRWSPGSRRRLRTQTAPAVGGQPTIRRYETVPFMGRGRRIGLAA